MEIIRQLDGEEAKFVAEILQYPMAVAIIEIRISTVGQAGYLPYATHVMNYSDDEDPNVKLVDKRLAAMVDNWIRLGLVEVFYDRRLSHDHYYEWVESRPEVIEARRICADGKQSMEIVKGTVRQTSFGRQFAIAVGLLPAAPPAIADPAAAPAPRHDP